MWAGLGVHDRTEWVFMMDQNWCSPSAEYAIRLILPKTCKFNTHNQAIFLYKSMHYDLFRSNHIESAPFTGKATALLKNFTEALVTGTIDYKTSNDPLGLF